MKNKKMYIFIGLMFLFVFITINTSIVRSEPEPIDDIGIKQNETGIYDLKVIKDIPNIITIDGSIKDNWTKTVELYDWCTGKGTIEDPYAIKNVRIDIKDQDYGIKVYKGNNFLIENCIFTNTSDEGEKTSGIYVLESENGLIRNNNFTFCKTGVFNKQSNNIVVSYNSLIGDFNSTSGFGKAFWMYSGVEVFVTHNYILDYYDGINIWDAEKCKIENNHIENYKFGYDVETGVSFIGVNDSTIVKNDFYGTFTSIQDSKEISTSNSGDYYDVIKLQDSYNILIYGNRFIDIYSDQLIIVDTINNVFILIGIACFVCCLAFYMVYKKIKK